MISTVPTFNSCTKCVDSPRHNTQPHFRLVPSFLHMYTWMTSQLNVDLICKLRGPLMCLAIFFKCYPWAIDVLSYFL